MTFFQKMSQASIISTQASSTSTTAQVSSTSTTEGAQASSTSTSTTEDAIQEHFICQFCQKVSIPIINH